MAVRKVYGNFSSIDTMRVLASLFEHDLDFQFIPVDMDAGEHRKEPFLSLSPFGDVPAFQEGDLTLFESRAVIRAISHTYPNPGKEQVYMEPKLQGIAAAWIDVEDHQFDAPASKLNQELVYKPKKGLPANEAVVAMEMAKLAKVLDVYEKRLSQSKYLGGDKFTSADLSHLPNLHYLMRTEVKQLFDSRPHVSAWCEDIMARLAWTKVVQMVDLGEAY